MADVIDIGTRRELFVDDHLIERVDRACPCLHPPVRREVVFQVTGPWENAASGCYNLFRDGDRIRMYYRGYYPLGERGADWSASQTAHLAESSDGIHFERPSLGLLEVDDTRDHNIIFRGYEAHNFCAFRDHNPNALPAQQYKAVGGSSKDNLHGFCSPDGIHWQRIQEGPLAISGAFDSVNVPLWDSHTGCYRVFSRYFAETSEGRIRAIQSCRSDDFIHWTTPEPHVYGEGVPLENFYTNATTPCPGAEHILLSFPMRFVPRRERDTAGMDYPGGGLSDAVFMSSRDGVHWDRTFMEAWIRPGLDQKNWSHRSCTPAVGIVETGPDEWSMYLSEHYGWDSNGVRRVTVRPHGLASMRAGYAGGEFVTRPLTFGGTTLRLNYSTSAVGSVRIELQDAEAAPLPGFTLADMDPLFGDELDRAVTWKGGGDLSGLAGRPVRLRVALVDADLFALRVAP